MKNLRMSENIKRFITMASAGVMLVAGSMTVKAESKKATVDDVITAMQNGRKIEVEMTESEIDELVSKAEKKIAKSTDLLPIELSEAYEALSKANKDEKETKLIVIAATCDFIINTGAATRMTYPESIQFDKVCDDVCKQLKKLKYGNDVIPSMQTASIDQQFINLDIIMQRSEEIKNSKRETYVTAIEADLGLHDDCYITTEESVPTTEETIPTTEEPVPTTEETIPTTEEIDVPEDQKNPPTGMVLSVVPVALSASAILATLASKKKKEKEASKVYKKTR